MTEVDNLNQDEELTEEDLRLLKSVTSSPQPEDRGSLFSFFNNIIKTEDTTKTSNLTEEEIMSIRTFKNTSLYADTMGLSIVRDYINGQSETVLGSALSRKGFLIQSAITQKREFQSKTKDKPVKKPWYKPREEGGE